MNNNNQEIVDLEHKNKLFWNLNQQAFTELLTFVDFVDHKLNIGLVEINFAQDRDLIIEALITDQSCQDIQFEILHFPDPKLRFLRDELVAALKQIEIKPDQKLILLITGLEKSIEVVGEYPEVLVNLNFVIDELRHSVCHPLILFLPNYALTRLAKYAPDFWAWGRKVFYFKTIKSTLDLTNDRTIFSEQNIKSLELPEKQERIDLLERLLSEYNSVDQQSKKQDLPTIINIYNQLGVAYRTLGEYQKSIDYLEHSLKIAREIKDRNGEANALNNLGNAYKYLGYYKRAIDYLKKSLAIFQHIGDLHGKAYSLKNLGNTYNSLGEYQRAIDLHQKSLAIFQQLGDRYGEAKSLGNLGNAYNFLREYQRAFDFYQQSLVIFQQIGNLNGEASSLNNLGIIYRTLGEYQRAVDFYQQSLVIFQQIGNLNGEDVSLMNLGVAYNSLGKYQLAIDYLQQSLVIAQQIDYKKGEGNTLNNLGNAYYSLKEYQKAIDYYQQSLEIRRQIGEKKGEADNWFNLGVTKENLQQNSEAKTAYENAKKLYQAIGLDQQVDKCDKLISSSS